MPALTPDNLFFYTAQVSVLVVALAAALSLLRPSAAFRLAACRLVFLAVLVLPFQPALRTSPAAPPIVDLPVFADVVEARAEADVSRPSWWRPVVLGLLGAGVLLRGLWLIFGLFRLRRLASRLPDATEPADIAELQAELGTAARVCFVAGVTQPVTFGASPAIVLLPEALAAASPESRRAIVCHELLHVQRRDWLWVLAEEAVLTLVWFVPAVWWLVGELQLAREQIVDRLTVAATGARRAYMEALLSAADTPSAPPLLAGFLRRRHLARRLVALAEEVAMSRVRLAVSGVLVSGVLAGSGAVALAAWPLVPAPRGAGQDAMAFQTKADGAGQLATTHREPIDLPGGLSGEFTDATILVDLVVDGTGVVTAARPVSFTVRNQNNSAQMSASSRRSFEELLAVAPPGGRRPFGDGAAAVRDIDAMLQAAAAALTQWRFEPPAAAPAIARISASFDLAAGKASAGEPSPLSGFAGMAGLPTRTVFARRPGMGAGAPEDGTLRVGGEIRAPQKVYSVNPVYPPEAMDARVQGVVIIEAKVGVDGSVADAWVVRSVPILDQAALDAVRQWRYSPTLLNGVAVPVICTVTLNFTLSDDGPKR